MRPEQNVWQMIGTVRTMTEIDGSKVAIIQTVRTTKTRVFEDNYPVHAYNDAIAEAMEKLVGKRAQLFGKIEAESGSSDRLLCGHCEKIAKNAGPDLAIAEVVANVQSYEFFPPKQGKKQFGELTLVQGENYIVGKAFKGLAAYLQSEATVGSQVMLKGRLSCSNYQTLDGEDRESVEIMADSNRTKVLHKVVEKEIGEAAPAMAWSENKEDNDAF